MTRILQRTRIWIAGDAVASLGTGLILPLTLIYLRLNGWHALLIEGRTDPHQTEQGLDPCQKPSIRAAVPI
jgi:hypothetical protein